MERSTVLVTLKTPFVLDKPMPADDLMFEKKHVSTEAVPIQKLRLGYLWNQETPLMSL